MNKVWCHKIWPGVYNALFAIGIVMFSRDNRIRIPSGLILVYRSFRTTKESHTVTT